MTQPIPKTKVTPSPGDLIEVQWDARKTRFAIFVRSTRTGSAVVRMEKVEAGILGVYQRTGVYSDHPRTIASYDVLRIVRTADELKAAQRVADDANAQRALALDDEGQSPSTRAIAWRGPWTCYARPAPDGVRCGHLNTKPTYHARIEVCAGCGRTRKASDDRLAKEGP